MPFSFRDTRKKASSDYTKVEDFHVSNILDEMETPLVNEEDTPLLGDQDKALGCNDFEIEDEDLDGSMPVNVLSDENLTGVRSFFFSMKQTKRGSFELTGKDIERLVKEEMENYKEGRQMGENLDKIAKAKSLKISEDKRGGKERREAIEKHAMAIETLKHLRKIQNRGNDIMENESEDIGKIKKKKDVINSKEVENLSIACLKSYDKEVAECKEEIEMLKDKLEDMTNRSTKEVSLLKNKCREFGKQTFELKNDNDRLEDEKEQLREMINEKNRKIKEMRMDLENERIETDKFKRKYEIREQTSTRKIKELEEQLKERSAEFETAKTQLKEKETWIKEEFRPIESRPVDNKLEDALTKEMQQLCKSKRSCEKQQRVDQCEKEAGPRNDNEELMAENFEALKKKAKRLLKDKSDAIKTLVHELEQIKQDHESSANDTQKELQIMKGKLQISSKDNVNLKKRLKHYETDISTSRLNRQRVLDENTRLKKRLSETAVEYESLKGRVRDLESERNEFPNRRSSSEGILKKTVSLNLLQEEMEHMGPNNTSMSELSDRAVAVIARDFECTKCARMTHEVTQLMTVNQNMTDKLLNLAKDNKIFSDAANEHLDKRMVLQRENRDLQEQIQVLKEEIEKAKLSKPSSEMPREYFNKQIALQKENGELKDKIRVLDLEIKTVKMTYKALLDDRSSRHAEIGMTTLKTCHCTSIQTSDKAEICSISSTKHSSSLRTQTSSAGTVRNETFGMTSQKGIELKREICEFQNFVHETITVERQEMRELANKIRAYELKLEHERSEKECKELASNLETMKKVNQFIEVLVKENDEFRWNIKHLSTLLKASERKEMKANRKVLKLRKLLKLEKENNRRKDAQDEDGSLRGRTSLSRVSFKDLTTSEESHNGTQNNVNCANRKAVHAREKKQHQRDLKRSIKAHGSPRSASVKDSEREFVIQKQDGILRQRNTSSENTGVSSGSVSTATTSGPLSTKTTTEESSRVEWSYETKRNGTGNKRIKDTKRILQGKNESSEHTGSTSRSSTTTTTVTEGSSYGETDGSTDHTKEVAQRQTRITQNYSKECEQEEISQESEEFVNSDEVSRRSAQASKNSNELFQGSENASKFSDEISEDSNEFSENSVEQPKKRKENACLSEESSESYETEETENDKIVAAKEMGLKKKTQLTLSELMFSNDDEISFSDWTLSTIESPRKETFSLARLRVKRKTREKALLRKQQEENDLGGGCALRRGPSRGSNHSNTDIMKTDSKTNLIKRKKSFLGGKTKYKKVNLSSKKMEKGKKRRAGQGHSSSASLKENQESKNTGSSTIKASTTSIQSSGKSTSSSTVKKGRFAYFKKKLSRGKMHKKKKKSSSSDVEGEFEKEGEASENKARKGLPARYTKGVAQGVQTIEKADNAKEFADDSEDEESSDDEEVCLIKRTIVKGEEQGGESSGETSKFPQGVSESGQGVTEDRRSHEASDSEKEDGDNKMRGDESDNKGCAKKKFSKISIKWTGFGSKKKKGKKESAEDAGHLDEMTLEKENETVGESLEKGDKKAKKQEDKVSKSEDKETKKAAKKEKEKAKKEKEKAKKEKEKANREAKKKEKAEKKSKQKEDAKQKKKERENEGYYDFTDSDDDDYDDNAYYGLIKASDPGFELHKAEKKKEKKLKKKTSKEEKKQEKKQKKLEKERAKSAIKLQKNLKKYNEKQAKAEKKMLEKQQKEETKNLEAEKKLGKGKNDEGKEEGVEKGGEKTEDSMKENGKDMESKTAKEVKKIEDGTEKKVEKTSKKENEKEITKGDKIVGEPYRHETQAPATNDVKKENDRPKPPVKGRLFEDAPAPTTITVTSSDDNNNERINFMPENQSPVAVADHVTAFSPRPNLSDDDDIPRSSLVVFKPSVINRPKVISPPKGLSSLVAIAVETPRKEKEDILVIDTGEDDFDGEKEENENKVVEPLIKSGNQGTKTKGTRRDNEVGEKTKAKEAKDQVQQNGTKKKTVDRRPRTSDAYESFWAESDDEFDFESDKDVKNGEKTVIKKVDDNNKGKGQEQISKIAPARQEGWKKESKAVFEFLLNDLDQDKKETKREEGQAVQRQAKTNITHEQESKLIIQNIPEITKGKKEAEVETRFTSNNTQPSKKAYELHAVETTEHYDNLFQEMGNAEVHRPASTGMPTICDYRAKKAVKGDRQQRARKGQNDEEVNIDDLLEELGMDDESQNEPAVQPSKNKETRIISGDRASQDSISKKKRGILNDNDSEIDSLLEEFGIDDSDQALPAVQPIKKDTREKSKYSGNKDLKSNKGRGKVNNEEKSIDDLLADLGLDE